MRSRGHLDLVDYSPLPKSEIPEGAHVHLSSYVPARASQSSPAYNVVPNTAPPPASTGLEKQHAFDTWSDKLSFVGKFRRSTASSRAPSLPPYGYTCPEPQFSDGMSSIAWDDMDRKQPQGGDVYDGRTTYIEILTRPKRASTRS